MINYLRDTKQKIAEKFMENLYSLLEEKKSLNDLIF